MDAPRELQAARTIDAIAAHSIDARRETNAVLREHSKGTIVRLERRVLVNLALAARVRNAWRSRRGRLGPIVDVAFTLIWRFRMPRVRQLGCALIALASVSVATISAQTSAPLSGRQWVSAVRDGASRQADTARQAGAARESRGNRQARVGASAQVDRDSLRAVRAARAAQTAFELKRRRLLPVIPAGSGGRCDVRLGRFCYWHDDDESEPPSEPASIVKERDGFIARLDSLAREVPGDGWIAGQRVRYLVESRDARRAVEAASACEAQLWWCRAVEGFALHALGDRLGADSAFSAALGAMPNDERCRWEDISAILPDRASSRYKKLACDARRAFADTLWWLAQPLWSVPGNDRRAEHFARHVMSRLERESRTPYEMGWGEDTHELLVRYGWPTSWSRDPGSFYDMTATNVVGYEPHPSFDFIPDDSAVAAPWDADADRWKLHNDAALSRYTPRRTRRFGRIDVQMSRFARGDSMLVVATSDVRSDTLVRGNDVFGALSLSTGPSVSPRVAEARVSAGRSFARVVVPNERVLASMELRDTVKQEAARARRALPPLRALDERGTVVSDVLLYENPQPNDATLEDVMSRALGRLAIPRRTKLGAFWELVRAAPRSDSVTYTLTVTPRDASWLRRMAARVGLGEPIAPVHIRFTEPIGDARVTARTLAFDLSRLSEGKYDVKLTASLAGGEFGSSERRVEIRR